MNPKSVTRNSAWPGQVALWVIFLATVGTVLACRPNDERAEVPPSKQPTQAVLPQEAQPVGPIRLTNVTQQTGISFLHTDGGTGQKYVFEPVSAGMALFDFDADGLIDIYFLNGAPLPPAEPDPQITNALYRNLGNMQFSDVTKSAGIADCGYGMGVVAGDYDSDGDLDLYINNYGPNVLYRNNGDRTFTDVTEEAGVACGEYVGAGAAFLDADGDGDLDLYVANYINFRFEQHKPRTIDGFPCYPGPLDYEPASDVLFRNNGDGTFTDVSVEAGIAAVSGTGMGVVSADYDNDRDTDIFVANDERGNFLLENDGSGTFSEVGIQLGVAFDHEGKPQGNMGVDCADYDHDGWLDFFTTTFSREMPVLYHNRDGRFFEDAILTSGAGRGSRRHVNWGTAFADFDNDRWPDLFIACGHLDQKVDLWNPHTAFRVSNLMLRNIGDGKFQDVSQQAGDGLQVVESSRGMGVDDLDNDGDVDIVILNSQAGVTVLRNDTSNDNHWLQIALQSHSPNRHGVGAQVRVTANGLTQLAEVHCGRGYQSHHGQQLHFGLGKCELVDRVEVRWIGGGTDLFENIAVDQRLVLSEGQRPAGGGSQ